MIGWLKQLWIDWRNLDRVFEEDSEFVAPRPTITSGSILESCCLKSESELPEPPPARDKVKDLLTDLRKHIVIPKGFNKLVLTLESNQLITVEVRYPAKFKTEETSSERRFPESENIFRKDS